MSVWYYDCVMLLVAVNPSNTERHRHIDRDRAFHASWCDLCANARDVALFLCVIECICNRQECALFEHTHVWNLILLKPRRRSAQWRESHETWEPRARFINPGEGCCIHIMDEDRVRSPENMLLNCVFFYNKSMSLKIS